ncbi:hypothetical protein BD414DRAFT_476385 [Trametes punicea]|nr:hypothetical protein BD414DRAFT_476385 [Trametes punicea]
MSTPNASSGQSEISELIVRLHSLLPPLLSTQRSSWEQGICAQALLECHRLLSETGISSKHSHALPYDLIQWLYALAHESLVRQAIDGRLSVLLNGNGSSDPGALDPACIGETLYYLCAGVQTGSSAPFPPPRGAISGSLLDGVEKMLQYIVESCPRAPVDARITASTACPDQLLLSHRTDAVQIWSDSIYMLSPFLTSAAVFRTLDTAHAPGINTQGRYAPSALMRIALQQIILAADVLQAPTGEWSHIYDLDRREFKRAAWWGVGNGWVCCGIVRIISTLVSPMRFPDAPPFYVDLDELGLGSDGELRPVLKRLYDILVHTLRACLQHILPSSLFHDVLDDPHSFVETNLSQMVAYTIYRLLDLHAHSVRFSALGFPPIAKQELQEWALQADAMRAAAVGKTDRWGFVRDVCGSPTFDKPGTAAEGQALGVLMEVARAQYLWHERDTRSD